MDPLSLTASIIAVLQLTVKVGECLRDAKDASTERSLFTTETSNLSNLLVILLPLVDESSNDPWHAKVRELGGKDGLIYQYRVALEQLKDKISNGHGLEKMAKTLLWKYIKDDAERILLRIERLKSLVQIALNMDHFTLSQAIESRMTSMHNDNKVLKVGVDAIQQDQDRRKHHRIMNWLSSADFPAQQSDFIARRQEDTGLWFLNSNEFTEWVSGASQTLFCPGIPGAGKTMMAAITVDHLQKNVQTPDVGVAYLYCNYKRQADQTTSSLLATILKQLVQDRPSIAEPLSSLYDHHEVRRTRPSVEETLSALQSVLANYSRVYVVIDALDECSDQDGTRSQLLRLCRSLQGQTDLRLMATSRHISDIVDKFKGMPRLEVRADNADVKRFVAGQTERLPGCVQRDKNLQELVQNKIVEAVDGMFLLARLHVDSLLDKDTKKSVKFTLQNLSRGTEALKEAYNGAIERIDGQLRGKAARAKSALSWISYAQRPLTTGELCNALAVELEEEELDPDNIPNIEDIVSVCAGLVTVVEESKIIRLVHKTTQEYLEEIREKWNPSAPYDIASTCLTYLCFKTFRSGSCPSDAEFESRLEQNVFLDYSARYWGQHAATVQEKVSELALRLLKEDHLVDCAIQTSSIPSYKYGGYSQKFPKQRTGLHLAASLGLLHLSEELLSWIVEEKVVLADSKDGYGRTPLSYAAAGGHEAVVKLLVERNDVEADSKDNYGRTPLSRAAAGGHEAVVKLLVEQDDVEADSKDKKGWTPLSYAAAKGHEAVVKLLVERDDVEANSKDKKGLTPLSWAAVGGHEAVVKLLVERDDVEADSKNKYGQTPLSYVAAGGHEAVVKLLVKRDDVEADSKNEYSRTPLSGAAARGHEAVVKLLVERDDVEADSKDDYSQTPLSWAAVGGHEAVVKLLVERDDVEADSKNKYGRTPLSRAAERGYEAVVKLLLKRGADVDVRDNAGLTPLTHASRNGYADIMKLLLGKSNQHRTDGHGRTALHLAAKCADVETFEYAFGLGIDRETVDEKGDGLLHYASSGGSLKILNAVLDDAATLSIQSRHWTPLHWACRAGNPDVVERLLNEGFRSECITLPGSERPWSPISIAFFHGNEKMLENISASHRQLLEVRTDSDFVKNTQQCGIHHKNALCDGCFHEIYGTRFRCYTCLDFDYCFMCYSLLNHLHESHEWYCVED